MAGAGARAGTGGGRVRATRHGLVLLRVEGGAVHPPRRPAGGRGPRGARAGTAGYGAVSVFVPSRARAAVEAGWLAGGTAAFRHGPARGALRAA